MPSVKQGSSTYHFLSLCYDLSGVRFEPPTSQTANRHTLNIPPPSLVPNISTTVKIIACTLFYSVKWTTQNALQLKVMEFGIMEGFDCNA